MNEFENNYKALLHKAYCEGINKQNRTGVNCYSLFGEVLKVDLTKGFPILTGKKIDFKKAYHEYIWFKEGLITTNYLKQHDINWWDDYADEKGNLGKTYGYQLRNYNGEIDQLMYIINEINNNSRRAHITLWNPSELNDVKLPVCYTDFTFVRQNANLNMTMHFRSSDAFLGLPYDIIVGALLLIEVSAFTELIPKEIMFVFDDIHLYDNHIDAYHKYVEAETYDLPLYSREQKTLIGYIHSDFIYAKLNV